jgi:hypothetical protein
VVAAISGGGCGPTTLPAAADSGVVADSAAEVQAPADAADTKSIVDVRADADEPACFRPAVMVPGLVCFGDDPAPYLMYLSPRDAGPTVGVCPAPSDFDLHLSEADPGYFPCGGPLTPEQIAVAHDAGAPTTDAGGVVCCYWVEERWGV